VPKRGDRSVLSRIKTAYYRYEDEIMTVRNRKDISTLEATRYEVALIRDDKVLKVLGYTARKTKRGIFNLLQGQDLTSYFTEAELDSDRRYTSKNGLQFGDGSIRISFTGRTEREVAKI
jgi:hypothetical protein